MAKINFTFCVWCSDISVKQTEYNTGKEKNFIVKRLACRSCITLMHSAACRWSKYSDCGNDWKESELIAENQVLL